MSEKRNTIRIAIALAVVFTASFVMADARDGLRHWWKAKDLNGDGLLQPSELYDLMTVGSATPLTASSITQNTDSPDAKPVSIATGVNHVTMHYTAAEEECFVIHNPTNYDSANSRWRINRQMVTLPQAAAVTSRTATVALRFRWDGIKVKNSSNHYSMYQYLYCNDHDWNNKRGWAISRGLYDSSASSRYPTLTLGNQRFRFGASPANGDNRISRGDWVEMVVSFSCNEEGSFSANCYMRLNGTTYPKFRSLAYAGTTTATIRSSGVSAPTIGKDGGTSFVYSSNGEDNFGGAISDIMVYDRVLSENEAWQVLADLERRSAFTIGSKNGSADEFSDAAPESVYLPDSMEWSQFRKTLTSANPSVSIRCNVETNGHLFGKVLQLGVVGSPSASARVSVLANGVEIGDKTIPRDGSEMVFWVSPSVMSNLVYNAETGFYPLTLTLRRAGDLTGSVELDHVYFGGSFQIGVEDDSSGEFGADGNYFNHWYCVSSHDLKRHTTTISQSNSGNIMQLHSSFFLSDWEAANLDYKFTVKAAKTQQHLLSLSLADPLSSASIENEYFTYEVGSIRYAKTITIPKGTFVGGLNHIFLNNADAGGVSVDYYSLGPVWNGDKNYDPRGIVFIFK